MSTIKIHNLGVIKDIEIDLKQFNLLIGEQATGKSTICKAVYFFRNFKDITFSSIYDSITKSSEYYSTNKEGKQISEKSLLESFFSSLYIELKSLFIGLFDKSSLQNTSMTLQYCFSKKYEISINISSENELNIKYNDNLIKFLHSFINKINDFSKSIISNSTKKQNKNIKNFFDLFDLKKIFLSILKEPYFHEMEDSLSTYYIPAGRSMLSLLTNQKTRINYDNLELINRKFMQNIEDFQKYFTFGIENIYKNIKLNKNDIFSNIANEIKKGLKGNYRYNSNGQEIFIPNNSDISIPVNHISSGQQEILWLYNLLYVLIVKQEKAFVIIEEPEAHLYPSLQKQIMEFIAQFINITGSSVIITTHSPYILTATNNLSYAGKLRMQSKTKQNRVEKLFGKFNYFKPDSINAIKLLNNNKEKCCENLIDKKTGEFLAEKIDEVSNEINEQYTSLFEREEE